MSDQDTLFRLIHSLDAGEKRFVSLSLSTYGKSPNNGELLFDAIRNLKSYDEDALKKQLKKHPVLKNFAVEKHSLYSKIVSALADYRRDSVTENRIRRLLSEAIVLYEKALPEACIKKLKAARQLAQRYETPELILEIVTQERRMVNDGTHNGSLVALHEEETIAWTALQEIQTLRLITNEFFMHWRTKLVRDEEELKKIELVIGKARKFDPEKLHTNRARVIFYGVMLRYSRVVGNHALQLRYSRLSLDMLEKNPEEIRSNIAGYFSRVINIIISYGENKMYAPMQEYITRVKKIPQQYPEMMNPQLLMDIRSTYYGLQFEAYMMTANFSDAEKLVPEFERWVKKDGRKLDRNHYMVICLAIANLEFMAGEYKKALVWLRTIIHETQIGHREDVQCFARILQLITHYKLNSANLLPSLLRSTYRFLLKRKNLFELEKELIRFIASRMRHDAHELNLHSDLKKLLSNLEKIIRDPVQKKALDFFDIVSWLESEIEGKSFAEMKREKSVAYK